MKKGLFIILFLFALSVKSQNITVDSQTYSPQQLIENVLIGNNCITNVQVTNAVGGNFNDLWKPFGVNANFNANLKILIFNRYGKLLAQTNPVKGWDGTFNGLPLPSDDYWYTITHSNGNEYHGHFSLVR